MNIRKILFVALIGTLFGSASVLAEEKPLVDGNVWVASSETEKEAYMIGAGNFMTIEYIVQSKADSELTDDQSSVPEWWAALEDTTINDVVAAVDAWYASNPGSMDTPVLVVVWNSLVETD